MCLTGYTYKQETLYTNQKQWPDPKQVLAVSSLSRNDQKENAGSTLNCSLVHAAGLSRYQTGSSFWWKADSSCFLLREQSLCIR